MIKFFRERLKKLKRNYIQFLIEHLNSILLKMIIKFYSIFLMIIIQIYFKYI